MAHNSLIPSVNNLTSVEVVDLWCKSPQETYLRTLSLSISFPENNLSISPIIFRLNIISNK